MNYKEASTGPDSDCWWEAMREEMALLKGRKTWRLEELPEGRKPIGCRWTYVLKYGPDGEISRYKA
jgi:hypothetical protein